jgi:lipopolysaccharide transport system ATP-binding protein
MASDAIITVENLGKRYSLSHLRNQRYVALRDVLVEKATGLFRRNGGRRRRRDDETTGRQDQGPVVSGQWSGGPSKEDFWALRNISFEVRRGEVVGIIGRNGAGKSTLLKILSRITEPTEGRVKLKGRVASLLEVGTGFHPELTGRENIYLNGAILGMHRAEIRAKFDEIVAFAETEKFLDTPVKRYSSGMYVRLAFAVAAHLEPEILVVDEVLAVGDAEFQKKCLGKMEAVARGGRTVLFVSHNMTAVESMCSKAMLLVEGHLLSTGSVSETIASYLRSNRGGSLDRKWDDIKNAPGNEQVRLKLARIAPAEGNSSQEITVRTPVVIELQYWNLIQKQLMNISLQLYNDRGTLVFSSASLNDPDWRNINFSEGLYRSVCRIPGDLLNNGSYRIDVMFVRNENEIIAVIHDLLSFTVGDSAELRGNYHGQWPGTVRPNLSWRTELLR